MSLLTVTHKQCLAYQQNIKRDCYSHGTVHKDGAYASYEIILGTQKMCQCSALSFHHNNLYFNKLPRPKPQGKQSS
uniref:Uncharacterized protein n=1 Tax=Arundo donax TaxID=35708 RepID=A0A0A9E1W2_ARUDO